MAEFEHVQLSLPRGTTAAHSTTVLSIAASYGGWELSRYRSWPDGRRKVDLRRRIEAGRETALPGLSV